MVQCSGFFESSSGGSTVMLTHRDTEQSAKTSTTKARENITLKSYSSNAEGGWTGYLLSDIFKDVTLTKKKKISFI